MLIYCKFKSVFVVKVCFCCDKLRGRFFQFFFFVVFINNSVNFSHMCTSFVSLFLSLYVLTQSKLERCFFLYMIILLFGLCLHLLEKSCCFQHSTELSLEIIFFQKYCPHLAWTSNPNAQSYWQNCMQLVVIIKRNHCSLSKVTSSVRLGM